INEVETSADDEIDKGNSGFKEDANSNDNMNENSDLEVVSETYFGDNGDELENAFPSNEKVSSPDPFNIYDLLQKGDGRQKEAESPNISHPPGFTQSKVHCHVEAQEGTGGISNSKVCHVEAQEGSSGNFNSKVYEEISEANGNSGGILYIWDSNMFLKEQHIVSDNFVALYGTWIPSNSKVLIISIYAPQSRERGRTYGVDFQSSWSD
nr:RNA-directed DNA polymerase, eukaryota [Tanacetum cinerariifolium]